VVREITPLRLADADAFIRHWHREHWRHPRSRFHRFSLGLLQEGRLVGAVIVGTPMSRWDDPQQVAEVLRLATTGAPNASSQLLAAAVRVCREMGYARVKMVVGKHESGAPAFLRATGFRYDGETSGAPWKHSSRQDTRTRVDREPAGPKDRWTVEFRPLEAGEKRDRGHTCHGCGQALPKGSRSHRKTCSDACRKRLSRVL
jgi:hypothetical protein